MWAPDRTSGKIRLTSTTFLKRMHGTNMTLEMCCACKSLVSVLARVAPLTQVHGARVTRETSSLCKRCPAQRALTSLALMHRLGVTRYGSIPSKTHVTLLTHETSLVLAAPARRQLDVVYVLDKELVEQEHLAALSARVLVCALLHSQALLPDCWQGWELLPTP